jgi:hypothetical protein
MNTDIKPGLLYNVVGFIILLFSTLLYIPITSLSYETKEEFPFENATHIQYSPNDEIVGKYSASVFTDLVKDPDGISFSGEPFKPINPIIWVSINDKDGKLRSYYFNLTDSGINQVSASDTQIYPSFSFKMPLGPNSTSLTIQEVSQFFNVYMIKPEGSNTTYYARSNQPLVINGSSYPSPGLVFEDKEDGTAFLSIQSYSEPIHRTN